MRSRSSAVDSLQDVGPYSIKTSRDQQKILIQERLLCEGLIAEERNMSTSNESQCVRIWDNIMCWPPTPAGQLAVLPCPSHIRNMDYSQNASRQCMENGTWFVHPNHSSWTNFSQCTGSGGNKYFSVPPLYEKYAESVQFMCNIGYGLSLGSLVIAVTIMVHFKKLHCARNFIHINLFVSFILRATMTFIRDKLLVKFVGFPGDVINENGFIRFRDDVIHWECHLFFTLYNYILAASYMWIFVEALYLQILISVSVFMEKNRIKWFMLLGWLFPLTSILPWVLVRILKYNELRLAKSILILIPLFGVYNIIFSLNYVMTTFDYIDEKSMAFFILFLSELFFNSFQGFILAMLFCFLNAEVQAEFKKVWHRYTTNLTGSVRTTRTFMSRTRNSVKNPSTSNGNASPHSDVISSTKNELDSELLAIFKKDPNCDNDNEIRVVDTEFTEEHSPSINNNKSISEKCDEKL
uniref:Parathyroid hormone/parathyroid hormone-related peptide receptor n=1 Tax=Magallana gigas TaxID=29159 RepID=A0A8W8MS71_MAGGI